MQQTLSVAIITKNEEANLARTLASVRFAGQIVVVDSGSTDRTIEIARAANATVYQEPWRGSPRPKTRPSQNAPAHGSSRSTPTRSSPRSCKRRFSRCSPRILP